MNNDIGGTLLAWVELPRLCRSRRVSGRRWRCWRGRARRRFGRCAGRRRCCWRRTGCRNVQIAAAVGVTPVTVRAWRTRFAEEGLARFAEVREGRGRKPSIPAETVEEIVRVTVQETPPGATHWSTRTMAARVGVSRDTVHRVWRARGLQPHRVETFKLSTDPRFEEKLVDVVGLYLNPPEKAVVLCLDEKSQVQALDNSRLGFSKGYILNGISISF